MPSKDTTPLSLYGNDREFLREQERTNELLADIAGETYDSPGDIPKGKYIIEKRLLDAAQKKNELLESIAGGGGAGGGAAKGIDIDYATDVISLKNKDGATIEGSGATLPAYGLNYDTATGGLTLTKNGTGIQGQTVALPDYGSPLTASSTSGMTDTSKVYVNTTDGKWYYYDGSAWVAGGTYNSQGIDTDTTLTVSGAAADAKATGDELGALKSAIKGISDIGKDMLSDAIWEFGNIATGGGNANSTTLIRTSNYMPVGAVTHAVTHCDVVLDSGYSCVVYVYDASRNVLLKPTDSFDVPSGADTFRVKIAHGDDAQNLDFASHISIIGHTALEMQVRTNADTISMEQVKTAKNSDDIEQMRKKQTAVTLSLVQGTINSSTGENSNSNYRVRTNHFIPIGDGIKIDFDSSLEYGVFFYGENDLGDYKGKTEFVSGTHYVDGDDLTIPNGAKYVRLAIKYASGNSVAITPEDITDTMYSVSIMEDYVYLTESTYTTIKRYIHPATPNIIYSCREGQVDSSAYPHNSKWAIKATADNEYDRIRFTTRRTEDGYYVLIHDSYINNLARNTDGTAISEQVSSNSALSVLDSYDWGIQYGEKYAGYKVPRLEDALYYANLYGLGVTLEFNTFLTEAQVQEVFAICVKYNCVSNLMV